MSFARGLDGDRSIADSPAGRMMQPAVSSQQAWGCADPTLRPPHFSGSSAASILTPCLSLEPDFPGPRSHTRLRVHRPPAGLRPPGAAWHPCVCRRPLPASRPGPGDFHKASGQLTPRSCGGGGDVMPPRNRAHPSPAQALRSASQRPLVKRPSARQVPGAALRASLC